MHFETIGARLQSLRKSRGLTQADVGRRSGLGREGISNFESGARHPTPGNLECIAEAIGVPVTALTQKTDWLSPAQRADLRRQSARVWREFGRKNTWRPPCDRDMSTRLRAAYAKYTEHMRRLLAQIHQRPDAETCLRVLSTVVAGSALEVVVHLVLLAAGIIVHVAPEQVEFRRHPVVDPKTREGVGNIPVPAYRVELDGLRCLFIPQVGLACRKCTWCVDFLVAVIAPGGHVRFLYVEIDGDGHDYDSDPFRTEDIDMPVVRLTEPEVLGADLLPLLGARIRETLHLAA